MTLGSFLPPRSWRWLVIGAAGTVLLYAVVGFLVVPLVARPRLGEMISGFIGRPTTIGSLRFNPFAVSATARDVVVLEDDGTPVIALKELYADVRALALPYLTVIFDAVELRGPDVVVVMDREGNLNLAPIFTSGEAVPEPLPAPAGQDAAPLPFSIARLGIDGGRLRFRDEAQEPPFEIELHPVQLQVEDLDTRKEHAARYALSSAIGKDGTLEWSGSLTLTPLRIGGKVSLEKVSARTVARYLGARFPFDVKKGRLAITTEIVADASGERSRFAIGRGNLSLVSLELRQTRESPPFLVLPELRAGGVHLDFDRPGIDIATVVVSEARLQVRRTAGGTMEPAWLFSQASKAEAEAAGGDLAWPVKIGRIQIDGSAAAFEDRSLPEPFVFTAAPINARIEGLSLARGARAMVEADAGLPDGGRLSLSGDATLSPPAADLDVRLSAIGLERFQPYVARALQLEVAGGSADTEGKLRLQADAAGAPVIQYSGSAAVRELSVTDRVRSEDLVKWSVLQLDEIAYASAPPQLHIGQSVVEQPYARILIDQEGKLNLTQLAVRPQGTGGIGGAEDTAEKQSAEIRVARLEIRGGHTDFADLSIQPNVAAGIFDLHGEVRDLSSAPGARSVLRLEGKVDKHSRARISGTIAPFDPTAQADVTVSLSDVGLTVFTPYSARFAGYKIRRGKASIELKYHVDNRRLKAENHIVFDKLALGERVRSPDATSLPVALAVALLKDRNGRIRIDLPVRGNLDDPQFSYTALLSRALLDLIARTVASPFSILGALANFDGEQLRYVAFAPGSSVLEEDEARKVDAISAALKERPALRLEITGAADRNADVAVLAETELNKALKRMKKAELAASAMPAPKKLAEIELSAGERERLLSRKYRETFGTDPPRDPPGEITEAARKALAASFAVEETALRALARKRAAAVQDRVVANGIDIDRIYLLESDLDAKEEEGEIRTQLSLAS